MPTPRSRAARPTSSHPAAHLGVNTTSLTIGIDLGDRYSHYCVLDPEGEVLEEGRLKTTRDALALRFGTLAPSRFAVETGTHANWVAEQLQQCGHTVLVANAREVQAITGSDRKCDAVDAEKLARYARVDPSILRPITPRTSNTQAARAVIRVRAQLVSMRTGAVNTARGLVKSLGHRLPSCDADQFAARCRPAVPAELAAPLGVLLDIIESVTRQIKACDQQIEQLARTEYPETERLTSIPGVGTLTALTFVLTMGDKERFARSRDVGPYLGLCPERKQSGGRDPQLGITKAGDPYLRRLLVQCAHRVLREQGPASALHTWGRQLSERGGAGAKKRALLAVARKLAVLLHKLWTSGRCFIPFYGVHAPAEAVASQ